MRIAITGHRPNKLNNDYDLTSPLVKKIKFEIQHIITQSNQPGSNLELITGMALGIDTLFALLAIENKIPFIAAIPCKDQEKMWVQKSKDLYQSILKNKLCSIQMVSFKEYDLDCMNKRNEWMVDNCDLLIAVWDGISGGTANCIKYAVKKKKQIIYIDLKELKLKYKIYGT